MKKEKRVDKKAVSQIPDKESVLDESDLEELVDALDKKKPKKNLKVEFSKTPDKKFERTKLGDKPSERFVEKVDFRNIQTPALRSADITIQDNLEGNVFRSSFVSRDSASTDSEESVGYSSKEARGYNEGNNVSSAGEERKYNEAPGAVSSIAPANVRVRSADDFRRQQDREFKDETAGFRHQTDANVKDMISRGGGSGGIDYIPVGDIKDIERDPMGRELRNDFYTERNYDNKRKFR